MIHRIPFVKVQSIGNDFPLVHLTDIESLVELEAREQTAMVPELAPKQAVKECSVALDTVESVHASSGSDDMSALLARLSIAMCERHFGIGGDGLLAVGMEGEAVRLRMFNPDGTEDFCGNGIRCAALHVRQQGWVGDEFTLRHLDREVPCRIDGSEIATTIGHADYDPQKVPHRRFGEIFNANVWSGMDGGQPLSLFGSALTTGSTHVVIPTSQLPDEESFASVSRQIEVDPLFPQRTSVIWSQETAPDELSLLIWERGVGETFGCGTGSSAAAADYFRRKGRGGTVTVRSKGGSIRVQMDSWAAPITIFGTAERVFAGEFLFHDGPLASVELTAQKVSEPA